ncbi:hypothetical protein B0H13DRAFT_889881 [Mycena leptocephala]|nr:hypothetical protein B0H13DRAFT_889881 [Mycena leptocephala]
MDNLKQGRKTHGALRVSAIDLIRCFANGLVRLDVLPRISAHAFFFFAAVGAVWCCTTRSNPCSSGLGPFKTSISHTYRIKSSMHFWKFFIPEPPPSFMDIMIEGFTSCPLSVSFLFTLIQALPSTDFVEWRFRKALSGRKVCEDCFCIGTVKHTLSHIITLWQS